MSKKYRLKNVIDKLEAIYCGPSVTVVRDFLAENVSSQKPRTSTTREVILYLHNFQSMV
jgi:hypothetical protein